MMNVDDDGSSGSAASTLRGVHRERLARQSGRDSASVAARHQQAVRRNGAGPAPKVGEETYAVAGCGRLCNEAGRDAGRRAVQATGHGGRSCREAGQAWGRPKFCDRGVRWRSGRRRCGISGVDVHARNRRGADTDDSARASRRIHRRQDRSESESRQKSHRRVSSAAGRADRS